MTRIIQIKDTLLERRGQLIELINGLAYSALMEDPDLEGKKQAIEKINQDGTIDEIIDSYIPSYYQELDDTWYLYRDELMEAYQRAGIGDNPTEDNYRTAIFLYFESSVREALY